MWTLKVYNPLGYSCGNGSTDYVYTHFVSSDCTGYVGILDNRAFMASNTGIDFIINAPPEDLVAVAIDSNGILTLNSLAAGGLVKADTSGNLEIATANTDYLTPTWTGSSNIANPLSVYASGDEYLFDDTMQLIDFGITDPSLTINAAGTYLLLGRVSVHLATVKVNDVPVVTLKLRRTNNTAADVAGAIATCMQPFVYSDGVGYTYYTGTNVVSLPPVIYTTANTNDIIQLWGGLDDAGYIDCGAIRAMEASIVAIRLY